MNAFSYPMNFGQKLHQLFRQRKLFVAGDHESPIFILNDETVDECFAWLAAPHTTPEAKAEFMHQAVLAECSDERLASVFDVLTTGDVKRLKRSYVMDLIEAGGHAPMLCGLAFGPDTRPTQEQENGETWKRRMQA